MTVFRSSQSNALSLTRHATLARLLRLLVVTLGALPAVFTSPIRSLDYSPTQDPGHHGGSNGEEEEGGNLAYLITAISLVLLGGAFAGLTIALMGQDEINLQVLAESGEEHEKSQAIRVLRLLRKGKHWVLVTLLLSNVITNETLPIVLDRSLGGGWPAVVASTVLIVIFGEIVPQSICVRYGLPIGAIMAPFIFALMWIMSPITWPIAKLLDYLLGENHGTTYKKAGLKTLVTLHRTLGTDATQRLTSDEVTIISSVLDLKDKPVCRIMTPIKDVFTLSADQVLDEDMIERIHTNGFSRIPIHQPGNRTDFIGMLLVKTLIMYDPEDELRVQDFTLATLPETRPETSCLDIVNFFQEGKSHMALVSDYPGMDNGAIGVVTLEDVIEELIGEEIIDESDVFVDVHKAIRRWAPGPLTGPLITRRLPEVEVDGPVTPANGRSRSQVRTGPQYLRRDEVTYELSTSADQLPSLRPSNQASNPRQTHISSITIKPLSYAVREATGVNGVDESNPSSRLINGAVTTNGNGFTYGTLDGPVDDAPTRDRVELVASRTSSSSDLSSSCSRAPKFIIPSIRPESPVPAHNGSYKDVPGHLTIVQETTSQSQVTVAVSSGRMVETLVDNKLVITPVTVEVNGEHPGTFSTMMGKPTLSVHEPPPTTTEADSEQPSLLQGEVTVVTKNPKARRTRRRKPKTPTS